MQQLKDKTILVVDDEPELREILAGSLQMEGGKTLEAESGTAAYALLETEHVDAVVSDIRMRNGDGLFLTRKIRDRDFREPPVLLITGYSDYAPEEVFDAGAEALLAKPFNMKTLVRTVKDAVLPPEARWAREAPTATAAIRQALESLDAEAAQGRFRLGRGGFFLALAQDFPMPGDIIAFSLRFANGPALDLSGTGRVLWARKQAAPSAPPGIGVAFETVDPKTAAIILERAARLKPKAYVPMA